MPVFRRFAPVALLILLLLAPLASRAQQVNAHQVSAHQVNAHQVNDRPSYPDDTWVPQGMDALGRHASFHTDFTFDRDMLKLASGFTGDDETQRIVAKLRGISVHLYRYPEPGLYNPAALDAVRAQYQERGWEHLVTAQANAASPNPGHTDLWIRFEHGNVDGVVLLVQNPTNLDLVAVNGTLSPLDLLHLRGHFGIPRFSGDRFQSGNDSNSGTANP
jgi:hypothetical protein